MGSIVGRNWLKHIHLDWNSTCTVTCGDNEGSLKSLLRAHEEIFKDELGTVCSLQATLHVRPDARLKILSLKASHRARGGSSGSQRSYPEGRMCRADCASDKKGRQFLMPSVEYLGHRIDAEGLHAMPSKLQTIVQAPATKNVQELQ